MTQEFAIPEGCWRNAKGAFVPLETIRPEDQAEDALVRELAEEAADLNKRLAAFKARALGDVGAYLDLIAEKYNAKKGGKKGNVTLSSYDGSLQLTVAVSDTITFGPQLTAAKALIDECLRRWGEGADARLRTLIDDAFQVDKQGKISTGKILGLRRHNFDDDETWTKAMEAISDAIRVTGSKTYVRVYKRDEQLQDMTPVPLDLARV